MKNTAPDIETRLRLKTGETQLRHVAAGTLILLHSGSLVQESAPRWLGENMHVTHQRLDAGSCLLVEETGWTRLTAERDCELTWIARAQGPGLLALLLTRLRGRHIEENRRLAEEVRSLRMLLEKGENCR